MGPVRARLVFWAYRGAERLVVAVPRPLLPALAALSATAAMVVLGGRRHMVGRHLRRVRGDELTGWAMRLAVWRAFRSYAEYWLDTFRLSRLRPQDIELDAEGLEHLDRALAAGRGAILATPHLGSWDLAAAWLAGQGYPLAAVVERLQPPELLEWFAAVRRRCGVEVIVRGDDVWDRLEDALGRNAVVALVCDRDLSGRGVEVELFGERTTLPTGPARLSRRCGTPLLPVGVYRRGRRHRGVVHPPVAVPTGGDERDDVAVAAQRLADRLEVVIRAAPEQWHLMQPNWPSDREA
jgi:phosphatidylinositol dimannoside acyltransferase